MSARSRFDEVFRQTYSRVLGYCLRRAPEAIAHDATAEVFSIAWRKRRELPEDDRAVPWLIAIARRVLANEFRSVRRRDRLADRLTTAAPAPTDQPGDIVSELLAELTPEDQEIVRLVYWDDLSHAEAAHVLGISVTAVGVRVHRARRRLRTRLEEEAQCRPT
jgi:RNA polymerase sigma-70 factor, ECF subfamily